MYNEQIQAELAKLKTAFEKSLAFLRAELAAIRAGRANPGVLDKVTVDYYGTPTPLKQMANIAATDARTLIVSLWDISAVKEASKAILAANLGLTPSDDGKAIRLTFPVLTEDRRKELVKQIKQIGENAKVGLRNARRDCLDFCKKQKNDKLISEDEMAALEKEVQKQTDAATVNAESIINEKEKEILTV